MSPIPKIMKEKRGVDVAEVIKHLPSYSKALSSNSSTAKKPPKKSI
jgi:hypothetical protein